MYDFSKNTKISSLEHVPENLHGVYTKQEVGEGEEPVYVISDAAKGVVEAVINLNGSLENSRRDTKQAKAAYDLSDLKTYGENVPEISANIKSQMEQLQSQIGQNSEAKINLDKIKSDLEQGHSIAMNSKDDENKRLREKLYDEMVTSKATQAIAEAKGNVELVMSLVKDNVKVTEENGDYSPFVVDEQGDRRYSPTTGNAMSISELVSEIKGKEKYGMLFESQQSGGGGTPPTSTIGKANAPEVAGKPINANAKIAAGLTEYL